MCIRDRSFPEAVQLLTGESAEGQSEASTCLLYTSVTEQLKAENQMEWVRQMNACRAQAEEVVKAELIYD